MTLPGRVVDLLVRRDIPHALIGAAALAARGVARSTFDIDLLKEGSPALNNSAQLIFLCGRLAARTIRLRRPLGIAAARSGSAYTPGR